MDDDILPSVRKLLTLFSVLFFRLVNWLSVGLGGLKSEEHTTGLK